MKYIPYAKQSIDAKDVRAVLKVLCSDFLTQGPLVEEFEKKLARVAGARYAVAVNSGTSALHLACLAAKVRPGDHGVTSPISFTASANCIAYCGGKPLFADIDPVTYNMNPEDLAKRLTTRTRVVIPVHFAGQSCEMSQIKNVVRRAEKKYRKKIYVIEDASHALGSSYCDARVGSCRHSDMTIFSFHPVKHMTTGEGGAITTNDAYLYAKLRSLRSHGITRSETEFKFSDQAYTRRKGQKKILNPWYYEQQELGFNFRITDLQCGLGISQLEKWKRFAKTRRQIVNFYNQAFGKNLYITTPHECEIGKTNFHLYVLRVRFDCLKITRAELMAQLKKEGIGTQVHYIPIYLQPFYRTRFGFKKGNCPNAEKFYSECLSIPLFHSMQISDARHVAKTFLKILSQFSGVKTL